jgi:hypothetical protein
MVLDHVAALSSVKFERGGWFLIAQINLCLSSSYESKPRRRFGEITQCASHGSVGSFRQREMYQSNW